MKRNELDRRYAKIRSLNQLNIEREKLLWMIEHQEDVLQEDYEDFRNIFSWEYISGVALDALQPASSLLRTILSGGRMFLSMFRGRSEGRRRRVCRK